jgi:carbonic anhydrase
MSGHSLVEASRGPRKEFYRRHRQRLEQLAREGQAPETLFIGCDDSRVIPEALVGAGPGELFVFRNIANIIPPYGIGERAAGATLEYALTHLHVNNIIVCGHTDCGGIHALDTPLDQLAEPNLARWIEYARPAQTQVDAWGVDPVLRHRRIVEQNVRLQMDNLRTYDVLRRALPANRPSLHGWVYDLATGRISYWDTETDRFVEESEGNDDAGGTS